MSRIAILVSNPCVSDARVIKAARAAVEAGHEVHVFATIGPNTFPYERVNGVVYHRLEWRPGSMLTAQGPLAFLQKGSRKVTSVLLKRLVPFLKYRLLSRVFVEHIVAVKPDIVHANDLVCLPAGSNAAQLCGAKLVYDAHELEIHRNPPLPIFQKLFVAYVEAKYGRRADAVITVGRLVGQELGKHLRRDDIHVIYNSPVIEPCRRHLRQDLQLANDVPLIVYVGKVTTGRGVSEILALLPKLCGVTFATVGPCDDKTRLVLEGQAERLDISARFRILPPVPFEQVVDYIRGADLGVISVEPITLSYQYCMPNKLFEMAFANVPIISNKLDEIDEFLKNNKNGEIADFSNVAGLAYKIYRMLNEKNQYLMTETQMEAIASKYSWPTQCAKLARIYESLISGSTPREIPEGQKEAAINTLPVRQGWVEST
jgi:glycosyltransferase involved in cell wall biosynthesis